MNWDHEAGIRYSLRLTLRRNPWSRDDILQDAREFVFRLEPKFDATRNSSFMNYYIKYLRPRAAYWSLRYGRIAYIPRTETPLRFYRRYSFITRKAFRTGDESVAMRGKVAAELGARVPQARLESIDMLSNLQECPDVEYNKFLPTPVLDRPVPSPYDKLYGKELEERFFEFSKTLTELRAFIFEHRIVADDPMNLQDIGDLFHVSRERVRQLETKVKESMAKFFADDL